jgi:hypothetical protein
MSSVGYPDYQRITQWLGAPLVQATGLVIGIGTHVDGPIEVANYASVIVAIKPTGGPVTVTLKQTVPAGPVSLVLTESIIVPAGATLFEAFVLFGQAVELDLTGTVGGTAVDYALYGSNTTTNAQVLTNATINIQHNDVLVAAEPTIDLEDDPGFPWSVVDDGPGTRVKVTPPAGVVRTRYVSSAQVALTNTVVETDIFSNLLNIPADAMGANGWARIKVQGGVANNTGAPQNLPKWKVYLNAVLALDTGFGGLGVGINSGNLAGWVAELYVIARGSRANQLLALVIEGASPGAGADAVALWTTGPGLYELRNGGRWSAVGAEVGAAQNSALALPVVLSVTNPLASPNFTTYKDYVSLETCYMP